MLLAGDLVFLLSDFLMDLVWLTLYYILKASSVPSYDKHFIWQCVGIVLKPQALESFCQLYPFGQVT